jgi:nucleoside-diphosphate-sugar epimerase
VKILITGGTGFIGKRVVRYLSPRVEKIYLLTRPKSINKAKKAFRGIENVEFVIGDITDNDVLHDIDQFFDVISEVDSILNLAGYYDLEISEIDSYTHNVIGVQNMIHLASKCKKLKYFHHISTYAVTGGLEGILNENSMDNPKKFSDHYARSKMQGESIFRNTHLPGVRKRIYRPGIVVGSIKNGEIEKIDGPYYLMRFIYNNQNLFKKLSLAKFLPLPFARNAILPLIPVDILSKWLSICVLQPADTDEIKSYNMIGEDKIYLSDFVEFLLKEYGIKSKIVRLKRIPALKYMLPVLGMPKELLDYMYSGANYDLSNRKNDYPDFKEYNLEELSVNLIQGSVRFFQERR